MLGVQKYHESRGYQSFRAQSCLRREKFFFSFCQAHLDQLKHFSLLANYGQRVGVLSETHNSVRVVAARFFLINLLQTRMKEFFKYSLFGKLYRYFNSLNFKKFDRNTESETKPLIYILKQVDPFHSLLSFILLSPTLPTPATLHLLFTEYSHINKCFIFLKERHIVDAPGLCSS